MPELAPTSPYMNWTEFDSIFRQLSQATGAIRTTTCWTRFIWQLLGYMSPIIAKGRLISYSMRGPRSAQLVHAFGPQCLKSKASRDAVVGEFTQLEGSKSLAAPRDRFARTSSLVM